MNLHFIRRLRWLYQALLKARSVSGRTWMRLQNRLHGVSPHKVLFTSFKGKSYSDSPRFISEALHALRPELEIVWQLADDADRSALPDYVRTVRPHSPHALRELSTARCFVDNFNRPIYLLKFPGQLYVQTWHGDRGFKKMLYDMNDGLNYPDGAQMDLAVSGSDFGTKNYRTAFHYSGETLQVGMPRNDALVNASPESTAAARTRLNLPDDHRILLYAPTFRDATAGRTQQAGFDLNRALSLLERATDEKWLCLVRAHDQNCGVDASGNAIRDVTAWPEMSNLLLAADLLITDYSSSAGDFALLNRPMILYQPDLETFVSSDREMYFDLRTCPYLRAESAEALYDFLSDYPNLPIRNPEVLRFYGATESGTSAQAVAQWISNHIS